MAKRGGYREGGGRPKGSKGKTTLKQEEALEYLRERIREEFDSLIVAKVDLALGLWVERTGLDGTKRVYQQAPDAKSIEWLTEMVTGKPKEEMKVFHTDPLTELIGALRTRTNVESLIEKLKSEKRK